MSYRVVYGSGSHFVIFDESLTHCHTLSFRPHAREPGLNIGLWLVLQVPIWAGGPVRDSIGAGLLTAEQYGRPLEFGVRMFDDYDEVFAWLPEASKSWATPQWFLLQDGRLIGERFGVYSPEVIAEFIRGAASKDESNKHAPLASAKRGVFQNFFQWLKSATTSTTDG